jgi:hypothetical protein
MMTASELEIRMTQSGPESVPFLMEVPVLTHCAAIKLNSQA